MSVIGRAIDLLSANNSNPALERDLTLWILNFASIAKDIVPQTRNRAHTDPAQRHGQLIATRDRLMVELLTCTQMLQKQ
jgi:hypothetical protein